MDESIEGRNASQDYESIRVNKFLHIHVHISHVCMCACVRMCVRLEQYFLAYLLPKNSILREGIDVLIGRLNQAGLSGLWNHRTTRHVITKKKMRTERKRGPPVQGDLDGFVAFNLSDVQSSFYTLMIGLSLSAMAFLYEFRGGKSNADSTLIIR